MLQKYRFTSDLDVYSCPPKQQASFEGPHATGAVNLARLTDTPLMLPSALFWCCHLGGKLIDGWTREDGTVEHLSVADLKLCVEARSTLGREQHLVGSRVFKAVPAEGCVKRTSCPQVIAGLGSILENARIHALSDFSDAIRSTGRARKWCSSDTGPSASGYGMRCHVSWGSLSRGGPNLLTRVRVQVRLRVRLRSLNDLICCSLQWYRSVSSRPSLLLSL